MRKKNNNNKLPSGQIFCFSNYSSKCVQTWPSLHLLEIWMWTLQVVMSENRSQHCSTEKLQCPQMGTCMLKWPTLQQKKKNMFTAWTLWVMGGCPYRLLAVCLGVKCLRQLHSFARFWIAQKLHSVKSCQDGARKRHSHCASKPFSSYSLHHHKGLMQPCHCECISTLILLFKLKALMCPCAAAAQSHWHGCRLLVYPSPSPLPSLPFTLSFLLPKQTEVWI